MSSGNYILVAHVKIVSFRSLELSARTENSLLPTYEKMH
jgi:hypothetical protein